jgi:hypothetical protein
MQYMNCITLTMRSRITQRLLLRLIYLVIYNRQGHMRAGHREIQMKRALCRTGVLEVLSAPYFQVFILRSIKAYIAAPPHPVN